MAIGEKTDNLNDLMAAKEEAKEKVRTLSEDELAQISSGRNFNNSLCPTFASIGIGDKRDMDEKLTDIAGLMADIDGFAE